jgi:uncharacterized membrane protein YeaQ/YmgE (transglycosylase-associated protein family)
MLQAAHTLDMAADYDRSILQEFADRLYTQAWLTTIFYAFLGALIGGVAGHSLGLVLRRQDDMALAGLLVSAVIGALLGWRKAFWLKVQAQQMLCQMMIEQHLSSLLKQNSKENDRASAAISF